MPNYLACSQDAHDALKADPQSWANIPLIGIQDNELELRNCPVCGSTLAIALPEIK